MKSYVPSLAGLLALSLSQPVLARSHTKHPQYDNYPSIEEHGFDGIYCPVSCLVSGPHSSSWTLGLTLDDLRHCDSPVLFDAPLDARIGPRNRFIRACAADTNDIIRVSSSDYDIATITVDVGLEIGWWRGLEGRGGISTVQIRKAARKLQQYLHLLSESMSDSSAEEETVVFARSKQSIVGLYLGRDIVKTSTGPVISQFIEFMRRRALPSDVAMQVCWPRGRTLGIVASVSGDIGFVQDALRTWARGRCLTGFNGDDLMPGRMKVFF
ncbi:hypothetical protein ASPSYDRAFT_94195 [Aspergillus sydowii CBS 593.65]|uniref:Ecp2 effector protein domain-containing protein n=1 Tax=Aspergillus sydowii CBS 593.65 TaxID=1036612 RepID=A0A1L9T301_9EURO|nr:uncharacterized protein ASPSYDRAFT_94195 [Aspergillus sydowii CBS 593.65]OJJ53693.1 hypothetical protein ASPSYDRAFT_94195 [Aspergillus sydowii CBS 593.65]